MIGNALAILRDVETMDDWHKCRKEEEEPRMEGKDDLRGVFLKEDLVRSMLLTDQGILALPLLDLNLLLF